MPSRQDNNTLLHLLAYLICDNMLIKIIERKHLHERVGLRSKKISNSQLKFHDKILIKCDICGRELQISYRNPDNIKLCKQCRTKKTCLTRYGVDSSNKSNAINNKRKKTFIKNLKVDCPFKSDLVKLKVKTTVNKKYGVNNVFQSSPIKKKIENTCLRKYGCKNGGASKLSIDKIYITKKKNKTFNTSQPEDRVYNFLSKKYKSVIRQYKDKNRYPFACDFYIPKKDLFIELNLFWTHGKEPFNKNNPKHITKLKLWESRINECLFYKNAINIWTVSDVEKREKAQNNNLNYIEIFDVRDSKFL